MVEEQTASMEDYLEAILLLTRKSGAARVTSISDFLGVTKPSVSYALKKLSKRGLVVHEGYGDVSLTSAGRKLAEKVLEKHQLLVVLLVDILGVGEETAKRDACRMEHSLSDETKSKLEGLAEFILASPGANKRLEKLRYYQENLDRYHEDLERKTRSVES
ncbi:MAG: metal-dependent transcriptional regulator [Actinomycetota bacterium]|nr:metal-dependent transcriptional regulator [Actinomycetota bacterium]